MNQHLYQSSTAHWSLRSLPVMSQEQFMLWQQLLEQRFGIYVSDQRKVYLQTRLIMRMRELSIEGYDQYYECMKAANQDDPEWLILVDRLTVHETRFFRDTAAFDVLESYISCTLSEGLDRSLSVWSVGCSSGEEPYSLAILLEQCLSGTVNESQFMVTATDVSEPVLTLGRKGVFSAQKLALISDELRKQYFIQQERCYQVRASLRKKVSFTQLNVLHLEPIQPSSMDFIFCQNLLIYFRRETRQEILEQLVQRLTPGGLLVLGISDMVGWTHRLLRPAYTRNALAFTRRKDDD